eukprot:m.120444 g.120444  ORF g.120444 m.120444 type:complete len:288 (-) comp9271_c0_seq4:3328-4191(-)
MSARVASHAGSWYSENPSELSAQLQGWLNSATGQHQPAKAIISPHAGYSYCGATGAHAFKQIVPENVKRIFILGPSHHAYLPGCALTQHAQYSTPLGPLRVDQAINAELRSKGDFDTMSVGVDEDEHSIEMQLSYIRQVMQDADFTIVPVLVGALTTEREREYGKVFAPYLQAPGNVFVISSDFCHWGKRFSYTHADGGAGVIGDSIERLDRQGMQLIEALDAPGFAAYLKATKNTICGRHPIAVLLNAIQTLGHGGAMRFLAYAQSSKCTKPADSSVSYAAASYVA